MAVTDDIDPLRIMLIAPYAAIDHDNVPGILDRRLDSRFSSNMLSTLETLDECEIFYTLGIRYAGYVRDERANYNVRLRVPSFGGEYDIGKLSYIRSGEEVHLRFKENAFRIRHHLTQFLSGFEGDGFILKRPDALDGLLVGDMPLMNPVDAYHLILRNLPQEFAGEFFDPDAPSVVVTSEQLEHGYYSDDVPFVARYDPGLSSSYEKAFDIMPLHRYMQVGVLGTFRYCLSDKGVDLVVGMV